MRIETLNGRKIVCGHTYPLNELSVGQVWAQADGADRTVTIREIIGDYVLYGSHGEDRTYEKDYFSFQCRYFKVVE